jgi:hypothetical protein
MFSISSEKLICSNRLFSDKIYSVEIYTGLNNLLGTKIEFIVSGRLPPFYKSKSVKWW